MPPPDLRQVPSTRKRRRSPMREEDDMIPLPVLASVSGPRLHLFVNAADRPYLFGAGFDGISQF